MALPASRTSARSGGRHRLEPDANGPYTDLIDFLTRLDTKILNSKLLESLIKAGPSTPRGEPTHPLENLNDAVTHVAKVREASAFGQISLFDER